jgi:hypothetical protein
VVHAVAPTISCGALLYPSYPFPSPQHPQEEVTTLFLYTLQPELLAGVSPQNMEQHFAVYRMRVQGTNVGPCINKPVSAYFESLPQALQSEKEAIVRTAAAAAATATVSDTSDENDVEGTGGKDNSAVVEDIGVTAAKVGVEEGEEGEPAATNTEAERVTADAAREAVEAIETVDAVEAAVGAALGAAVGVAVGAAEGVVGETAEPMHVESNDTADVPTSTSTSSSPPIPPPSTATTTVTTTAMTTETAVTPLKTVPPFPTVPTLCCCPMVCSFSSLPIREE